jgi:hypothetical protein
MIQEITAAILNQTEVECTVMTTQNVSIHLSQPKLAGTFSFLPSLTGPNVTRAATSMAGDIRVIYRHFDDGVLGYMGNSSLE